MTDQELPEEMEALEEAAVAPEAMGLPPMMMGAPMPAHKQLYQFFWGGCAVLFGCLLRFNMYAPGWDAATYQEGLEGPIGLWTVGGSIVAFTSILFIGAQLWCMKHRRVLLGPIVIMLCVCVWSWLRFTKGMGCENLGLSEHQTEAQGWTAMFYNADTFVDFWSHLGPGFLFTLVGSSYVVLIFLKALLGVGGGGKKKAAEPAPSGGRGRGRRR